MDKSTRERKRNAMIVAGLGIAAAAFVAVTVFGVPTRTLFFYGAIALCPLMHLFMHGSHGHGAHEHDASGTGTGQSVEVPVVPAPSESPDSLPR